jgi:hypothetical protein
MGRTGKRRSLFLVSATNGDIKKKIPFELDQAESPCLLPNGRQALVAATKDGVADIYLVDLETGETRNLTNDAFFDSNPRISPDGSLVVYNRRVSGNHKIVMFPIGNPTRRVDLTVGAFDDVAPYFSTDGSKIYYSSNEDDGIYNLRSLDLKTGVIQQFTDAMGGTMAPAPVKTAQGDRVAFISYFKGEYQLYSVQTTEPMREVEQGALGAAAEVVDFQPDVTHQVVAENKRRKKLFEGLFLEGRPPINLAFTSNGDFYGGSAIALSDVLGDQNFVFSAYSIREYRNYTGQYANLAARLQWGIEAQDTTYYSFPSQLFQQNYLSREDALFNERYTGATAFGVYPLNKFNRLHASAGVLRIRQSFPDPLVEQQFLEEAAAAGSPGLLYNGTLLPLGLGYTRETTRFREFGPLSGSTVNLNLELGVGTLARKGFDVDARKYLRVGGTSMLLAARARFFYSSGEAPRWFYFGGNMEMRGFDYYSFIGNRGGFGAVELRIPLIDVMATPLGLMGPVRATAFANVGGAHFEGQRFQFWTTEPGTSYVSDPLFGQPVSGRRLVDARASYGVGVQAFLLGLPMHFDWAWRTDFQIRTSSPRFQFWIGYDF